MITLFTYASFLHSFCLILRPALSLPKPGCLPLCGNLKIPFPFGVGSSCSTYPTRGIHCNTSTNPPKPYLSTTNLEIVEFNESQIRVKYPHFAVACDHLSDNAAELSDFMIDLSSTPYTLSEDNWLDDIGYNDFVTVVGNSENSFGFGGGCSPFCSNSDDSLGYGYSSVNACCGSPIPSGTSVPSTSLSDSHRNWRKKKVFPCSYASNGEKNDNWLGFGFSYLMHDLHNSTAFLNGLVIGVGSLLLLLPIWCWLHKLFQTRANKKRKEKFFKRNGDLVLQQQTNESKVGKTEFFPSKELNKATDDYNKSRKLGVRASDFGKLSTVDQTHVTALIFHGLQKNLLLQQQTNESTITPLTVDQTHVLLIAPLRNLRILMMMIMMIIPLSAASSTPTRSQHNFPITKPNCLQYQYCGNISIPFPFGTTQDCYHSPTFLVTCNQTASDRPKLFLQDTSIDITEISLDGQITVLQDILFLCTDVDGATSDSQSWIRLPQHFIVSNTVNKFITVGCYRHGKNPIGNCAVKCGGTLGDLVPLQMQIETDGPCMDFACCVTSIPAEVKEMQIDLGSYYNNNSTRRGLNCSYAFLGEETALNISQISVENLKNVRKLPMVANWFIGNRTCEEAQKNSSAYACKSRHSTCYMPENSTYGYRCRCWDGYEGNPYLDDGCNQIQQQSKSTIILSIGLGVGIGSLLLLSTCFWLYKLIKKRAKKKQKQKFFKRNGGLLLQQQTNDGTIGKIQFFPAKELDKATDHFNESRILGQGGQGTVYKGMLSDGQIVAIKKSKQVNKDQLEQFINEVAILSQINHRNVVKLVGCCLETEVPLLVYEFVPNGTLFNLIHDPNTEFPISWDMRLKIAADSAGALAYLHSACSLPIYHRDIKSSNILLDEKYVVKVSDFGTSKSVTVDQTHVTTLVKGTPGYLDPEYFQSSQFTEKSDVYSFGVVLIELLTGQRAVSSDDNRGLVARFLESMEMDGLDEILDDQVSREGKKEEVVVLARLARRCLNLQGRMRPTMKEVATELESVRMSHIPAALSVGDGIQEVRLSEDKMITVSDFEYSSTTSGNCDASSSLDSHPLKFETVLSIECGTRT